MLRPRPMRAHWRSEADTAVKKRLRELYRTLDPVALLAEIREAQTELGTRVDARAGKIAAKSVGALSPAPDAAAFAKGLARTCSAASSAPSTGDCANPARNGFACRPCSIRTSRTSSAGLRPIYA